MLLVPGPAGGFIGGSEPSSGMRRNRIERARSEGVLRLESALEKSTYQT